VIGARTAEFQRGFAKKGGGRTVDRLTNSHAIWISSETAFKGKESIQIVTSRHLNLTQAKVSLRKWSA
jgi:hypothetical protein